MQLLQNLHLLGHNGQVSVEQGRFSQQKGMKLRSLKRSNGERREPHHVPTTWCRARRNRSHIPVQRSHTIKTSSPSDQRTLILAPDEHDTMATGQPASLENALLPPFDLSRKLYHENVAPTSITGPGEGTQRPF